MTLPENDRDFVEEEKSELSDEALEKVAGGFPGFELEEESGTEEEQYNEEDGDNFS